METVVPPTRRNLLAAALLAPASAWAAEPPGGKLAFAVFRNGDKIGDHRMTFTRGDGGILTVSCAAAMAFKIGPLKIDYAHEAQEHWKGDDFQSLTTASKTNGKAEQVKARRTGDGVVIETGSASKTAPADCVPFSHWNLAALKRPLFNPQNGKLLRTTVDRTAAALPGDPPASGVRWAVRGPGANIDDWYDAGGVWVGLRGRLPDGSLMEYRRV